MNDGIKLDAPTVYKGTNSGKLEGKVSVSFHLFLKLQILENMEWSEITVDDVYNEDVAKTNLLVQAFETAWRKREEILFNMLCIADPTCRHSKGIFTCLNY